MNCFAQQDYRPGYIIKNNGDSIAGFINYVGINRTSDACDFKNSSKSPPTRYLPAEIQAYGFRNNKQFESKDLSIDTADAIKVFAEKLVKGKMSLYRYVRMFYIETDSLIHLPPKTHQVVYNEKGKYSKVSYPYIVILNPIIAHCGLNANNIRYEEADLTKLVLAYNKCQGVNGVVFKSGIPWTKINWQIFSGIDISTLEVDELRTGSFRKSVSPIYGIGIDISSPRLYEKIFLTLEASYLKKFYQGYREVDLSSNAIERTDHFFNASFIKVPFGLRYNFFNENNTPYLKGGLVHFFKLDIAYSAIVEIEDKSMKTVWTSDNIHEEVRSQSGIWLGAGYNKTLVNRYRGFVEFRYERANGFVDASASSDHSSSTVNFTILAGLRF